MQKLLLIFVAAFGTILIFPAAEEACTVHVDKLDYTDKDKSKLLYTCESKLGEDCFCVFDYPFQSEIGWTKIIHTKNSPKIRKKKVRKRQVTDQNLCGTISPPKPGRVSCFVSRTEIKCTGTCDNEHQFVDGNQKLEYSCQYADGVWKPDSVFPPCKPKCIPSCKNGGTCAIVNFCACDVDFRGNACQYPISLCSISKNRFASNWKCNHTSTETTCDISCHAPDTPQAEVDVIRHECTIQGVWDPPLPPCVEVIQCPEPAIIQNGWWELIIGQIFSIGSKIAYTCEDGFILEGESDITCNENGTWIDDPPRCIKDKTFSVCQDPGEVDHGHRNNSAVSYAEGSIVSYACKENFVMLGNAIMRCMVDGQWSSSKPQCVPRGDGPVFCSRPHAPKNSVVYVSFPAQHPLSTFPNKDMLATWYVINLTNAQDGEILQADDGMFLVGTRVQYRCKSRYYKLYGSEYQTCLSSRMWSGYQPACVPECGKSDSPRTPFIVNGNSTYIGQWPWQVGLAMKTDKGLLLQCGGVLINELWVLTAAHCVTKRFSNVPVETNSILVFCGKYFRSFQADDEHVQVKQVLQIIIHEEYDFVNFDVDLALLQLENPVELNTRVQPICLPTELTTRENIRDSKEGIVIGWGLTENGRFSETLKESILPVVSHERCEEAYRQGLRSVTITRNMFCAGFESGQTDTCNGDSGGPFMFAVGPSNDVRWYVEGIVSWGSQSGCGSALRYSGFTKVGRFVPWINMFI